MDLAYIGAQLTQFGGQSSQIARLIEYSDAKHAQKSLLSFYHF
jgi:hypothetical protein